MKLRYPGKTIMKIRITCLAFVCLGVFGLLSVESHAQERCSGPAQRWVAVETGGLANDYMVEFVIPKPRNWRVEARGNKEKKALSASEIKRPITEGQNRDRIRVIVVTGKRARLRSGLNISIDEWANALSICYTK